MKLAASQPYQTDCPAARPRTLSTIRQTNRLINKQTDCSTNKQTDQQTNRLINKETDQSTNRLTVDDDDLHHGKGEEGQRLHWNFDKDRCDHEDKHDDKQTAHHTQTLRNPDTGRRSSRIKDQLRAPGYTWTEQRLNSVIITQRSYTKYCC